MDKFLHNTEKNKNIVYLAAAAALAAIVLSCCIYMARELRYMFAQPLNTSYIDVVGTGETQSIPDIAEITYTLRAESVKVTDAQAQVKTKAQAALEALQAMSIDEKDIKTIAYSSYPKYEYKQTLCQNGYCPPVGTPTINGYEVTQSITVKIRNVDQVEAILEKLGSLGISELSGPNFTVDEPEKIQAKAREAAIQDAKDKARILSKQLGVKIVRISGYTEGTNDYGYPGPTPLYKSAAADASIASQEAGATSGITQGQNTVTSTVTITYEVKQR